MASFKCTKCRKPISIDPELQSPSVTTRDLLRNASTTPRPTSSRKAYPVWRESYLHDALADSTATARESITPMRHGQGHAMARQPAPAGDVDEPFVVLEHDEGVEVKKLHGSRITPSMALTQQRRFFEMLSEHADVPHPLCTECTETLLRIMHRKMSELERDRKLYLSGLRKLKDDPPTAEARRLAETQLADLKQQEVAALEELRSVERDRADVLAELAQLKRDSDALDEEERLFWLERNKFSAEIVAYEQERDSIDLRYDHDVKQLERLQRTNVYNDTFHVGHDGNFGTINGLRLGKLPNHPVSWDEINAAWGITLLLLQTMAERLDYTFQGYKLHPMGSTSRIDRLEDGPGDVPKVTTLELFGSSDVNPLRLFQRNSFDRAVVAFLECLKQLGDLAETKDPTVVMPYKIVKDKIGNVCVRTAFNQDEGWTRALKFCLTNCKWILAVVQGSSRVHVLSKAVAPAGAV